jgi:hypothetical protein
VENTAPSPGGAACAGGLFPAGPRNIFSVSNHDLAPDGKCIAALVADDANGEKPPTRLTFLLNFFDEPRRRVPTGK